MKNNSRTGLILILCDTILLLHFGQLISNYLNTGFGSTFYLSDIQISDEALDFEGGSPVLSEHILWYLGQTEIHMLLLIISLLILTVMFSKFTKK